MIEKLGLNSGWVKAPSTAEGEFHYLHLRKVVAFSAVDKVGLTEIFLEGGGQVTIRATAAEVAPLLADM